MGEHRERARRLVEEYPGHSGNETVYLQAGFADINVPAVVAILLAMLRSGDRDTTWHAVDFINQAVIRLASAEFTAALAPLGVYRTLRDLLSAPDCNIRKNAIYALGKTTHAPNARYLVTALPTYLERRPLELDGLLSELFWLSRTHYRRRWEYFERVLAAPSFLVRWSLIEALGQCDDRHDRRRPAAKLVEQSYERLAADPHPLVRTEGAYALNRLRQWWQIDPRDQRAQLDHISRRFTDGPELTFTTFTSRVWALLHATGRADYDLPLLEAFAAYLAEHPIPGKFDETRRPRAFERWRAGR